MARDAFSPPVVDEAEVVVTEPFPCRARGRYAPWHPGETPRSSGFVPTSSSAGPATPNTDNNTAPPPPDPVALAIEQGQAQGHAEGYAQGQAQAEQEAADRLHALQTSLTELLGMRDVLAEVYRHEMVELALAAAEALVQSDLLDHRERLGALLDQAIVQIGAPEDMHLCVHPNETEATQAWAQTLDQAPTLRADPRLHPGDFRLCASTGTVESLMHERVHRVRQLVLGELAASGKTQT